MKIILREERTKDDYRYLEAKINKDGDLVFEGQDLGEGVKSYYGCIEYEWIWTIKAEHLPLLEKAMGKTGNILKNIELEFGGHKATNLYTFLKENNVPFEVWSRIGD